MDETTRNIIERITKSFSEPREVPGGHLEKVFYDCSQLTQAELARLGAQIVSESSLPHYDMVIGIAYRGIAFAAALAGGKPLGIVEAEGGYTGFDPKGKTILLVDDVLFVGKHLSKAIAELESRGGLVVACGCIVDRSQRKHIVSKPVFAAIQLP